MRTFKARGATPGFNASPDGAPKAGSSITTGHKAKLLFREIVGITSLLLLSLVVPSQAQQMQGKDPSYTSPNSGSTSGEAINLPRYDPAAEQRRIESVNASRHESIVANTSKLLELAQELEIEIGQRDPDSLTPAQLSKVVKIQKLARKVKSEMSDSVRDSSQSGR